MPRERDNEVEFSAAVGRSSSSAALWTLLAAVWAVLLRP
jgi:hypothetical protein